MTKSRIAIFEGLGRRPSRRSSKRYGAPLFQNPRLRGYGFSPREMPRGMGAPLFQNPRMQGYGFSPREMPHGMGAPLFENQRQSPLLGYGDYGRRSYYVVPKYTSSRYGPATEGGRKAKRLKRKGYKVKKARNSKHQVRFKKVAKLCARRSRNGRKGSYQACMKKHLRKGKRSRR